MRCQQKMCLTEIGDVYADVGKPRTDRRYSTIGHLEAQARELFSIAYPSTNWKDIRPNKRLIYVTLMVMVKS